MLQDKGEGSGDVFSGGRVGEGWERAKNMDWLEPINKDWQEPINSPFDEVKDHL